MKTKLFFLLVILSMSGCSFATAETADYFSDERAATNFFGLVVNTNANVILTQGESVSVRVEGDRRLINSVQTTVTNGALIITGTNSRPVTIYVTVQDLNLVEVNGSGKVYSTQPINSDMLLLKVNGEGSIKMDVRALTLGMIVKGKGKIIASGSVGDSFVRVFGKGNIYAQDLDAFHYTGYFNRPNTSQKDSPKASRRPVLNLHQ